MNLKRNILVTITILMVCIFCLVSCDIMGVEISFLSSEDSTEETSVTTPKIEIKDSDDGSSDGSDDATTKKPVTTKPTTTTKPATTTKPSTTSKPATSAPETTTKPSTTEPDTPIDNQGPNTGTGYGPVGDPIA